MKTTQIILAVILSLSSLPVMALDFFGGESPPVIDDCLGGGYDPDGDIVRTKLIFVTFPQNGFSTDISHDRQGQFLGLFDTYIQSMSNGKLAASSDSEILLPPGILLDPSNPIAGTWQAELPAADYRDSSSMPPDYSYAFLSDWWYQSTIYPSPLFAEIMYKIWDSYKDEPGDLFPLPSEDSRGWQLAFFFLTDPLAGPTVWSGNVGGRPNVQLHLSAVNDTTGGFYENLEVPTCGAGEGDIAGVGQMSAALDANLHGTDERAWLRFFIHEFIHTLGPFDGPPNLNDSTLTVEETYFYGNLNVICQAFPHTNQGCEGTAQYKGMPPLFDPALALLPWNTGPIPGDDVVINFSNTTYRNQKIYSVGSGGQFYQYDLPSYPLGSLNMSQYFLLSYHSGNGLDDQGIIPGSPVVPSQGLAIWHCLLKTGAEFEMVDLESAHGLYDYPSTGLDVFVPHWDVPGIDADEDGGFDNYDPWEPTNGAPYRPDYCYYDGFEGDFFQLNTNPNLNKPEFSYATNPNTNGYDPNDVNPVLRRRQQTVSSGMVVRVKDTGTDAFGDFMIVDLLHAPSEEVVSVDLDTMVFSADVSYDLTLSTDDAGAITTYDVLLSTNGGKNYWYTLAEDVVFDPLDPVFTFTPETGHGTSDGKLLFRFQNTADPDKIGIFENPGTFTIDANVLVRGDIQRPDGGEILFEGIPMTIDWVNFFAGDPAYPILTHVVIEYLSNCLADTILVGYFSNPDIIDPPYDPYIELNKVGAFPHIYWTPPAEAVCSEGVIEIEFHTGSSISRDVSDSTFAIYPAGFQFVAEDSLDHGVDYVGEATGTAVWDFNGDGKQDLFVAVADTTSRLYENQFLSGALFFADRTLASFADITQLEGGATAVAVADCDNDGSKEIFVAHASTPGFFKKDGNGEFADILSDTTYFKPEHLAYLTSSTCGSFADFDHDGDLDLYVGRATIFDQARQDALFRNSLTETGNLGFSCTAFDPIDTSGLFAGDSLATKVLAWSDMDGDQLFELALGQRNSNSRIRLFAEGPAGQYTISADLTTPGSRFSNLVSLGWVDIDRDNSLELFAVDKRQSYLYQNDGGNLNLTPDEVILSLPDGSIEASRARDINLDGLPELIRVGQGEVPVEVYFNTYDDPTFSQIFLSIGQAVGADASESKVTTLAVSDFDQDGDPDFILGRSTLAGRVLRCLGPNNSETPINNWIRFKLSGDGEDNLDGVGAMVSITTSSGDPLGMQVLSANSSVSGQEDPLLTFGLGQHASSINVLVKWPLGYEQEFLVGPENFNGAPVILNQPVGFQMDGSSVTLERLFDPVYGHFDWIFTWQTDRFTSHFLDQVVINRTSPFGCGFTSLILSGPQSVDPPIYKINTANGTVYFEHRARIRFFECYSNCGYSYTVQSESGGLPQISSLKSFTVKACPSY